MKVLVCGPPVLTEAGVVSQALESSGIEITELSYFGNGAVGQRAAEWAKKRGIDVERYSSRQEAVLSLEEEAEAAVIAILDPESPEEMETVDLAERAKIPVFVYRELFRRNARVNCRLAPIARPDVWIKAMENEHSEFFQKLWKLCQEHRVNIAPSPDQCGEHLISIGAHEFEGLRIDANGCWVRSRGSMRNRKIPVD